MTKIQNPKQLASDLILDLDIEIWNLFVIWCLYFVVSGLFGLGICSSNFCINCPEGVTFPERNLGKSLVPTYHNKSGRGPGQVQRDNGFS